MHFASPSIDQAWYPKIIALVLFGDPGNRGDHTVSALPVGGTTPTFPDALARKLKQNCAVGDPVSTILTIIHTSYLEFTDTVSTRSAPTTEQQLTPISPTQTSVPHSSVIALPTSRSSSKVKALPDPALGRHLGRETIRLRYRGWWLCWELLSQGVGQLQLARSRLLLMMIMTRMMKLIKKLISVWRRSGM